MPENVGYAREVTAEDVLSPAEQQAVDNVMNAVQQSALDVLQGMSGGEPVPNAGSAHRNSSMARRKILENIRRRIEAMQTEENIAPVGEVTVEGAANAVDRGVREANMGEPRG